MKINEVNNQVTLVDINKLILSNYNPRKIGTDKILKLSESIQKIGFVVPVIFNQNNNVLIAGHQRIRAALKIGISKIPAIALNIRSLDEEVNLNILHNTLDRSESSATRRRKIFEVVEKYGNIFYTVKNMSGSVLYGRDYFESEVLEKNVVVIKDENSKYFLDDYGKYDYSSFQGFDYNQQKAQMNRAENMRSQLYKRFVYPNFEKYNQNSYLDFGSGKGFEVKRLRDLGADIDEIEFYHKNGEVITDNMIDKIIKRKNLYDGFIVDSVFNSVTKKDYQVYIIQVANAFLNKGGKLFISSRSEDFYKKRLANNKIDLGKKGNKVYSLDDDNFALSFKGGLPFFQKFDNKKDVIKMAERNGFVLENEFEHTSFYLQFSKFDDVDEDIYKKAMQEEFCLPKKSGGNYNYFETIFEHIKNLETEDDFATAWYTLPDNILQSENRCYFWT